MKDEFEVCHRMAELYAGKNWHQLAPLQQELVGALEKLLYLEPTKNGFVGASIKRECFGEVGDAGPNFTQKQRDYVAGVKPFLLRHELLHQVRLRDLMEKDRDAFERRLNRVEAEMADLRNLAMSTVGDGPGKE